MSDTQNITISHSARRYALGVLVVVYTFNFIDRQILSILLPAIKAEFLVDDWVLGFLAALPSHFFTPRWVSRSQRWPIAGAGAI